MFDDLRAQASVAPFLDEEEAPELEATPRQNDRFLGMTPIQRFVLSVMLLLVSCIFSAAFLLITGKVAIPGF